MAPPAGPDLAFVPVKARGLPAVALDGPEAIDEGTEVATAGFPMGTDALMAPGWIHQVTPTLQRGIISAVLPFPCPTPHAYCQRHGTGRGEWIAGVLERVRADHRRPLRWAERHRRRIP